MSKIEEQLKALDYDGSGKVTIADAAAFINDKFVGKKPAAVFAIGVLVGGIGALIVKTIFGG